MIKDTSKFTDNYLRTQPLSLTMTVKTLSLILFIFIKVLYYYSICEELLKCE
ncbi:hypothetical protein NIES4071_38350 [Calothrix sp. NIES-4071]|nr:hypothetical protein NIES4071_38350 [Calothrix sp. NIES-4071]BAZ58152.1 hypothetical protein NIES4105_38280 [Calothrix sp. NIES-4105]